MTRRAALRATWISASFFCTAFVAIAVVAPRPRLIWNASASTAVGLYRVDPLRHPARGDLVVITPPDGVSRFLAERRYLPLGVPLMKHVAALPGQTVCRSGAIVTIDGRRAAVAQTRDRLARPLPVWQGCHRVGDGELFLLNPAEASLDGRYFGIVPTSGVIGRARPLLTRAAPGEPLRWHGLSGSAAFSPPRKDELP